MKRMSPDHATLFQRDDLKKSAGESVTKFLPYRLMPLMIVCLISGLFFISTGCSGNGDNENARVNPANDDDDDDDDFDDDDDGGDDTTDDSTTDDDTAYDPDVTPGFALIRPGTFTMGSPANEPGRVQDEKQHTVTLTGNFEMSVYETTQEEYTSLMGWNPSHFGPNGTGGECGDDCPVETVSWFDALAYANELSLAAGYAPCVTLSEVICKDDTNVGSEYLGCMNSTQVGIKSADVKLNGVTSIYECEGFRLPTEAEWEYATRAGTKTAFYSGPISVFGTICDVLDPNLDAIAVYCGNDSGAMGRVGQKQPNAWGLHDTSGNAWEWNWDWYDFYDPDPATDPVGAKSGTDRVIRGGSWYAYAWFCRSAFRAVFRPPSLRCLGLGFRLARSLHEDE